MKVSVEEIVEKLQDMREGFIADLVKDEELSQNAKERLIGKIDLLDELKFWLSND